MLQYWVHRQRPSNRVNRAERDHTILRREKIAGDMWNDYVSRALPL